MRKLSSRLLTSFGSIQKTIEKYGGLDATDIFPVQVSALCNGVDGGVSPWVTLESSNASTSVSQYHDFRAYSTDYRPDWYMESECLALQRGLALSADLCPRPRQR